MNNENDGLTYQEKQKLRFLIENISRKEFSKEIIGEYCGEPEDFLRVIEDYEDALQQKISTPEIESYDSPLFIERTSGVIFICFYLWFDGKPSDLVAVIDIYAHKLGNVTVLLKDILVQ